MIGQELSHVQFRSLEEQLFRAMAVLFDQKQRQGVARVVGMNAPVSIFTPPIKEQPGDEEITRDFLDKCYAKWPFALTKAAAKDKIADRMAKFSETVIGEALDEPKEVRRRIR